MDKIEKALRKLSPKERERVKQILEALARNDFARLDVKKLKGREDIFRARKGEIRILYRLEKEKIFLLAVERRSGTTYK
ncbi:MAG: hypothetical protein Q8R12_01720 [bacterium]|nr:hypothetical protein [bacterium]